MKATDVNTNLTYDKLRANLSYNPDTGIFTWNHNLSKKNNSRKGKTAGSFHPSSGYMAIWVDQRQFLAHRLAWFYVYGEWPTDHVDHIDGDKCNNRIANLRLANNSQNKSNGKLYKHSTSGFKGVSKVGKRWKAQIVHGYKNYYLGCFDTKEQAHDAYIKKANELQGEFARPS